MAGTTAGFMGLFGVWFNMLWKSWFHNRTTLCCKSVMLPFLVPHSLSSSTSLTAQLIHYRTLPRQIHRSYFNHTIYMRALPVVKEPTRILHHPGERRLHNETHEGCCRALHRTPRQPGHGLTPTLKRLNCPAGPPPTPRQLARPRDESAASETQTCLRARRTRPASSK